MLRHRLTQLVAVCLAAVMLLGATLMAPVIKGQRRELQLTFDIDTGDYVPPHIALLTTALGSFRGLAVNVLWFRAEQLKRENRLYESNTLARAITTLQPRFPQAWSFHAWNMAYNISVITHTPQERWDWVNKGVKLLREEGLVYNPNTVPLYKELAWIFFHKIGQYSDDMHWYYKVQLAQEWQELLGAPTQGATTSQALAEFKPVADTAERYFVFNRPPFEMQDTLLDLAEAHEDHAQALRRLADLPVVRLAEELPPVIEEVRGQSPALAQRLTAVDDELDAVVARALREPRSIFLEDAPEVRPLLDRLGEIGLSLDTATLRRIGALINMMQVVQPRVLLAAGPNQIDPTDRNLLELMLDPELRPAVRKLITYLRAKALVQDYNMDPGFMYRLMELYGPVDWRHPAAHSLYWAGMGVRRSERLQVDHRIDLLNTDRSVIHSLQELMKRGRVTLDPLTGKFDMLPDPRFIPAYEKAVFEASDRAEDRELNTAGTIDAFESGHENFLQRAVLYLYLYGETEEARTYYDKVRRLYGDRPRNVREGTYDYPLADFVLLELQRDAEQMDVSNQFIEAMVGRAFMEGLANNRPDVFRKFINLARVAHKQYQARRDFVTPTAPRQRLLLAPFDQLVVDNYAALMRNPGVSLLVRARVYQNSPSQLRAAAYPRFAEVVRTHAEQQGFDPDAAFPPPPEGLLDITPRFDDAPTQEDQPPATIQRF